jgi:hypothetical protein
MDLWLALDGGDREKQSWLILDYLTSFIFESAGDEPFSSGLIYFLAVLGKEFKIDRLRTVKDYSYVLAGVVYCVRVPSLSIPPSKPLGRARRAVRQCELA